MTENLEEVNDSSKKLGEVIKESNSSENENTQEIIRIELDRNQTNIRSFPISDKVSTNMKETLGVLMNSRNSLKTIQDNLGKASILRILIFPLCGDRLKVNDNVYDLNPEVNKALPSTSYSGKNMTDEIDILMMNNKKN